jgi:glycosyltransferase involved in cell wall biosynthesis
MTHRGIFKTLLQQQGVYNKEIAVIPEAVDASVFDPSLARGGGIGYRLEKTAFQLLSIFKWEHRKGWDILLEAYWTAFSREDDVVLRLRTYIPSFSRKQLGDNVTAHIERFAMDTRGLSLHELAPVVWERGAVGTDGTGKSEDRALTREDMRDLMASADAFVLPTRGEGWGLPIAEAMSMALPTIVTNATGPTAYATDENAYLIDASGPGDHMGYVQPSVVALTGLLKQVQREVSTGEAAAKGAAARRTMQELSPHKVVAMMVERVREHALRRGYSSI